MQRKEFQKLKDAIREAHGCEAIHVRSAPVKETFQDQTAWEGTVQVFDLIGYDKANRAYAWSYNDGEETKTVIVLKVPPVDSPQAAVKVAIASRAKRNDGS
jgi:hypothetical protein